MKKLFILLLLISSYSVKAQTTIYVGQEIESVDTLEHQLVFGIMFNPSPQLIYIQLDSANTSVVKFKVSGSPSWPSIDTQYGFPKNSRVPITIQNGTYNLYYKAGAIGEKFVITN